MILPDNYSQADIACVDILIGVGIATVIMGAVVVWQDWRRR